jgi:hypothetical protein
MPEHHAHSRGEPSRIPGTTVHARARATNLATPFALQDCQRTKHRSKPNRNEDIEDLTSTIKTERDQTNEHNSQSNDCGSSLRRMVDSRSRFGTSHDHHSRHGLLH